MKELYRGLKNKIVVQDRDPTSPPKEPVQLAEREFDPTQAMFVDVLAELHFRSVLSGDANGSPALENFAVVKRGLLDILRERVRVVEADLKLIERAQNR
jgi:hypothetical protein